VLAFYCLASVIKANVNICLRCSGNMFSPENIRPRYWLNLAKNAGNWTLNSTLRSLNVMCWYYDFPVAAVYALYTVGRSPRLRNEDFLSLILGFYYFVQWRSQDLVRRGAKLRGNNLRVTHQKFGVTKFVNRQW